MPGDRSSRDKRVRVKSVHVAVSSFAALAGVAIAAWQAMGLSTSSQQPVNVTVAMEPPKVPDLQIDKTDAIAAIATASVDLEQSSSFSAALKDGEENRYAFDQLFDGKPETYLTVQAPDTELNVFVTFGGAKSEAVTAISYTPPPGIDPQKLASTVDVTVLPDGEMGGEGRPVYSFTLQRSPGSQTFAIPGRAEGRGLWLRISGQPEEAGVSVGDFRIIQEKLAP
jgi:hypothetical protein